MTCPGTDRSDHWYALQAKRNQELRAEANLRAWGVETLLPRIRETRRFRTGAACRLVSLFPNYLFARFGADTMAGKVRLTRGVRRIVGFGEPATPIDDHVIAFIRSRIDGDGVVREEQPGPGDMVEIIEGPLRSLVGVFEGPLQARDRVLVLLTLLGSRARVQVHCGVIRKLERSVA